MYTHTSSVVGVFPWERLEGGRGKGFSGVGGGSCLTVEFTTGLLGGYGKKTW